MQAHVSAMSGVVELTPDAAAVGAAAVEDTQEEVKGLLVAAPVPKEDATWWTTAKKGTIVGHPKLEMKKQVLKEEKKSDIRTRREFFFWTNKSFPGATGI